MPDTDVPSLFTLQPLQIPTVSLARPFVKPGLKWAHYLTLRLSLNSKMPGILEALGKSNFVSHICIVPCGWLGN